MLHYTPSTAQVQKKIFATLFIAGLALLIGSVYAQPATYKKQSMQSNSATPKYATPAPQNTFTSLEGTFKKEFRIQIPFMGKRPTFYIEDSAGRRLAYVDTSQLLCERPLTDYLNQKVVVTGPTENSNFDGRIIHAANIQLARRR